MSPRTREEELEACPDFIMEAVTEEGDSRAIAQAFATGDAERLLAEVRKAARKYREYLVENREGDEGERDRLDWLINVYGPAWRSE